MTKSLDKAIADAVDRAVRQALADRLQPALRAELPAAIEALLPQARKALAAIPCPRLPQDGVVSSAEKPGNTPAVPDDDDTVEASDRELDPTK